MQRTQTRNAVLTIAIVAACYGARTILRRYIPSHIEYQGQRIKLSKFYFSYEDYKDDPENIDPSENRRVNDLVTHAPIARSFASRADAIQAEGEIPFPGYGWGGAGVTTLGGGKTLY